MMKIIGNINDKASEICGNCLRLNFKDDVIELIRNRIEGVCEVKTDEKGSEIGMKVIRNVKCKACEFFKNKWVN